MSGQMTGAESVMKDELISRARAGDAGAFQKLIESHRRELHVHCYRMLGCLQDAEDTLQETLLRGKASMASRGAPRMLEQGMAESRRTPPFSEHQR